MTKDLYYHIRTKPSLTNAWKKVYQNGIRSESVETQKAVKKFGLDADRRIIKIQRQLQKNEFKFIPAKGVPIQTPGKDPRPIVISDIKNSIVQRSILDVIQSQNSVSKYVNVPTSFGGLEGKSVHSAISHVCQAISTGFRYYITSDIKKFFTRIPRLKVIDILSGLLPDQSLNDILNEASKTELENLALLGSSAKLFPSYELGVAQGYCLSPLFGNVLLHDFDNELNSMSDEYICLRYSDDFIILGRSMQKVSKAYKKSISILKKLHMDAYHAADGSGKAHQGSISNGLEYLGCFINESFVHPSKKSRNKLKNKIENLLSERGQQLKKVNSGSWHKEYSLIKTLQEVSNILMGWGNQYSFCNSKHLFKSIDSEVNIFIKKYFKEYSIVKNKISSKNDYDGLRRLLGVHLLTESNYNPILPIK